MVDVSQINDANTLITTKARAEVTIEWLDGGGRINYMQVAPPPNADLRGPIDNTAGGVNTEGWDYPPTMVAAIRQYLVQEIDEIDHNVSENRVGAARLTIEAHAVFEILPTAVEARGDPPMALFSGISDPAGVAPSAEQ